MPVANIRGVNIRYQTFGEDGPWVALIPGGRRSHDEFIPLAKRMAAEGYRVLLHDRRNTGASDILIAGADGEEPIWTDDLHELLRQLNALPAFIGGSSSGARTSMLFYLRHPEAVRGLMLFRVTGGAFAEGRLPHQYYGQYIKAAEEGGMAAVCATEQYQERIAANPAYRDRLLAMDPRYYIATMRHWLALFTAVRGARVMGLTDEQLRSIKAPTIVIPGNDKTHSSVSGKAAHELIPGSQLHLLPIADEDRDIIPMDEWAVHEPEIVRVFVAFMKNVAARETKAAE